MGPSTLVTVAVRYKKHHYVLLMPAGEFAAMTEKEALLAIFIVGRLEDIKSEKVLDVMFKAISEGFLEMRKKLLNSTTSNNN